MSRRLRFDSAVLASLIVVCVAQVAVAQVEWTLEGPVVLPGDPGDWDSAGHRLGDVVFDGSIYHMYLLGAQVSHPFYTPWSVGHWTSSDLTGPWEEDPNNPVLEPGGSRDFDSYTIYNLGVLYDGSMFHMWYGAAASQEGEANVGYATSPDGSTWAKYAGNPLPGLEPGEPGEWDDAGMVPTPVLFDGELYRMWTTGVEWNGPSYGPLRIGYAESLDGLTWEKHPEPVLDWKEPWEGDWVYFPEVVSRGSGFAMWYGGLTSFARVGYAFSPDGIRWSKWYHNPVLNPQAPCDRLDTPAVIIEGDTVHGWFHHCEEIYYGTSPLELIFFDGFETGDTSMWSMEVP